MHQKPTRCRYTAEMWKLPWWCFKYTESCYCTYNNICTGHSCILGHALSAPVFYYSLLLNFCDFNAVKFFSRSRKAWGRKNCVCLFYCEYSKGEIKQESPPPFQEEKIARQRLLYEERDPNYPYLAHRLNQLMEVGGGGMLAWNCLCVRVPDKASSTRDT